jgi:hypothetical protein
VRYSSAEQAKTFVVFISTSDLINMISNQMIGKSEKGTKTNGLRRAFGRAVLADFDP